MTINTFTFTGLVQVADVHTTVTALKLHWNEERGFVSNIRIMPKARIQVTADHHPRTVETEPLEAGKWYSIRVEYSSNGLPLKIDAVLDSI